MNARTLIEAAHRKGCACGFCKNKGNIGNWRKKKADAEKTAKPEETLRESEGAVKLSKGTGADTPAAKAYHNMTSKQAMTPGWKTKTYVKAAAELSGMNTSGQTQGFKNKSMGQTTSGKAVPKTRPGESRAARMVDRLLDSQEEKSPTAEASARSVQAAQDYMRKRSPTKYMKYRSDRDAERWVEQQRKALGR
jgi:hypothetical protein